LFLNKPGARLVAINAAYIAKVPEPHIGFTKAPNLFHLVDKIVAAANASNMGALPGSFL